MNGEWVLNINFDGLFLFNNNTDLNTSPTTYLLLQEKQQMTSLSPSRVGFVQKFEIRVILELIARGDIFGLSNTSQETNLF